MGELSSKSTCSPFHLHLIAGGKPCLLSVLKVQNAQFLHSHKQSFRVAEVLDSGNDSEHAQKTFDA